MTRLTFLLSLLSPLAFWRKKKINVRVYECDRIMWIAEVGTNLPLQVWNKKHWMFNRASLIRNMRQHYRIVYGWNDK